MLDKYILKVKIHPIKSSLFHGICKVLVMMAAFLATLNAPSSNCIKQNVNKMHASL